MTPDRPLVSVVIPVRNAAATIRACLDGLLAQSLADRMEIVVVDSGSSDGTLDILARYPLRLYEIERGEFNHGSTRNLAISLARGEFIALTVQDARPVDANWLAAMHRHFHDAAVSAVCGQQVVPHDLDKNPTDWFRPHEKPALRRVQFTDPDVFTALAATEQAELCCWDNVTALYRRSALDDVPFRHISFGEDMAWAKDALLRGHALVYDCSARVYHYHNETMSFRFRREFTTAFHRYELFGARPSLGGVIPAVARRAATALRRRYTPAKRLSWLAYNLRLGVAQWSAGLLFRVAEFGGGGVAVAKIHERLCPAAPEPRR
jgi:rhamnosyltransferase